jgi:hypothetical protein
LYPPAGRDATGGLVEFDKFKSVAICLLEKAFVIIEKEALNMFVLESTMRYGDAIHTG